MLRVSRKGRSGYFSGMDEGVLVKNIFRAARKGSESEQVITDGSSHLFIFLTIFHISYLE